MQKVTLVPLTPFDEAVSSGFQYSLLNKDYQALHPPVQCKDFITDAFGSEILRQPFDMYKFKWNPGTMDITTDWFLIALSNCKSEFSSKEVDGVNISVSNISEALGIAPISTELHDGIIVVDFHKAWIAQPMLLSALMLLLRVGINYSLPMDVMMFLEAVASGSIKVISPLDSRTVNVALPKLMKLIQGVELVQTWEQYSGESYKLHHFSGILNYAI